MRRCLELAKNGQGSVSPNPLVGCVIVVDGKIIGEGYHKQYGKEHAEVNAINSVEASQVDQLKRSTLYVNLEPCAHFGKTPPCSDLIIRHKIPNVVISNQDPFPKVDGNGISKLRKAGVNVVTDVLKSEGEWLNRFFFTAVRANRPYIILKFAQDVNGVMGNSKKQVWITTRRTKRLVHGWRNEVDAILVGTNTALTDNPALTNRLWSGNSPIRIVLDRSGKLKDDLQIFEGGRKTILVTENSTIDSHSNQTEVLQIKFERNFLQELTSKLYSDFSINSLIVEGGAFTIRQFMEEELWDEARILTSDREIEGDILAPELKGDSVQTIRTGTDTIQTFLNT